MIPVTTGELLAALLFCVLLSVPIFCLFQVKLERKPLTINYKFFANDWVGWQLYVSVFSFWLLNLVIMRITTVTLHKLVPNTQSIDWGYESIGSISLFFAAICQAGFHIEYIHTKRLSKAKKEAAVIIAFNTDYLKHRYWTFLPVLVFVIGWLIPLVIVSTFLQ